MNITIRATRTYLEYASDACSMFTINIPRSSKGRKSETEELARRSSPHGILLKKGISGGKFEYVMIIIVVNGTMNKNDKTRDILTN